MVAREYFLRFSSSIDAFLQYRLTRSCQSSRNRLFFAMAKDKDSGEYLFATEVWHRRLLDYEETTSTNRFSLKQDVDQGHSMSTTA